MSLEKINNLVKLGNGTLLFIDSPAYQYFEPNTGIKLTVTNRLYIENVGPQVLNNMKTCIEIKDPESKVQMYFSWPFLRRHMGDLNGMYQHFTEGDNPWFIELNGELVLSDKVGSESANTQVVKMDHEGTKSFSIKPSKSMTSALGLLTYELTNKNKSGNIALPTDQFREFVLKIQEIVNNFEVIRTNLVNQLMMRTLLEDMVKKNNIEITIDDSIPSAIPKYIKSEKVNEDLFEDNKIEIVEQSDEISHSNFESDFIDDDSTDIALLNKAVSKIIPTTELKYDIESMIENTPYQSLLLNDYNCKLENLISKYFLLHLENINGLDVLYLTEDDDIELDGNQISTIKKILDNKLKPMDKTNPDIELILHGLTFPCSKINKKLNYKNRNEITYKAIELIIISFIISKIRNDIFTSYLNNLPKEEQGQSIYRCFTMLNYECCLYYILELHSDLFRNIDYEDFKLIYNNIISCYAKNSNFIDKDINSLFSQFTSEDVKYDSFYILKDSSRSCWDVIHKHYSIIVEDSIEKEKTKLFDISKFNGTPVIANIFKTIPAIDEDDRLVLSTGLKICNLGISQILDFKYLDKFIDKFDRLSAIYKWCIINWNPMFDENLLSEDYFRKISIVESRSIKIKSKYELEQYEHALSLKMSNFIQAKKILDDKDIYKKIEDITNGYDLLENSTNLYDDVKREINSITGNPFTTNIITEYIHNKKLEIVTN